MTSTTDPTVPLPTPTDTDDDDDDDDVISSLLPSQPPAATPPPAQLTTTPATAPPPAGASTPGVATSLIPATTPTQAPGISSGSPSISQSVRPSSATGLADSFPSGSASPLPTNSGGDALGAGASAGIGIGVALIVCLAAFGTWFFLRRRKARRIKILSTSSHSGDEEHAPHVQKSEVYAYRAGGPVEVSGDEKPRRWSELESPTYVAEAGDGQVYRAELPGSVVPATMAGKGTSDRLFADVPINEVDEPIDPQERTREKKREDRLFSDPPIEEGTNTFASEPALRPMEKKG